MITILATSGCTGDGDGDQVPGGGGPATSAAPPEQSLLDTWRPDEPQQPVAPRSVTRDYTEVLDATARASTLAAASADPDQQVTLGRATVSTDLFNGRCVIELERSAPAPVVLVNAEVQRGLQDAVVPAGFSDVLVAADPAEALVFAAEDSDGALFEFRSSGQLTVSIRVATTRSTCNG